MTYFWARTILFSKLSYWTDSTVEQFYQKSVYQDNFELLWGPGQFYFQNFSTRQSRLYKIPVISNGFTKLEYVINGRGHVASSQSEAKWPLFGEGGCK